MSDIYTSLFEYEDLIDLDPSSMAWGGIKMKEDFGPLKKNSKHNSIFFFPETGVCKTYNSNQEETNSFNIKLTAI